MIASSISSMIFFSCLRFCRFLCWTMFVFLGIFFFLSKSDSFSSISSQTFRTLSSHYLGFGETRPFSLYIQLIEKAFSKSLFMRVTWTQPTGHFDYSKLCLLYLRKIIRNFYRLRLRTNMVIAIMNLGITIMIALIMIASMAQWSNQSWSGLISHSRLL